MLIRFLAGAVVSASTFAAVSVGVEPEPPEKDIVYLSAEQTEVDESELIRNSTKKPKSKGKSGDSNGATASGRAGTSTSTIPETTTTVPDSSTTTTIALSTTTIAETTTTTAPQTTTTTEATTTTSTAPPSTGECDGVLVSSSDNIQAVVDGAGAGITFCFTAGTYSLDAPIRPHEGQVFRAVSSRSAVISGGGSLPMAFDSGGHVKNVTVDGLVVRDFKVPNEGGMGAIKAASGWVIRNSEIHSNQGVGLYHGSSTTISGNSIHHNSNVGIVGYKAHGSVITGNEVWSNGAAQMSGNSAGAKWVGGKNLTIKSNHFHSNYNNGLWLDGDNINAVVENNTVSDNRHKGLHFEVSCSSSIRNNKIERNGEAGLMIVASQGATFSGNVIRGNATAIEVWHQNRGSGSNCSWTLSNIRLEANTVSGGSVGVYEHNVSDPGAIYDPADTRVVFDRNQYSGTTFKFPSTMSWSEWQEAGNDPNGSFK